MNRIVHLALLASLVGCAHASSPRATPRALDGLPKTPTDDPILTEQLMTLSERGDERVVGLAQRSVAKSFAAIDRVWGGVFSASGAGTEKTTIDQAVRLRLYAKAWRMWRGSSFKSAALDVDRYVERFLTSPEGAFYAGQAGVEEEAARFFLSLDDEDRTSVGVPAIDERILVRDNAAMITALAELHLTNKDPATLARAERAAKYLSKHLRQADGGYGAPADTIAMIGANVALYTASQRGNWLAEVKELVELMSGQAGALSPGQWRALTHHVRALADIGVDVEPLLEDSRASWGAFVLADR